MHFEGEHLLPGQWGHFFVLLAFVTSLVTTIGYGIASTKKNADERNSWLNFSRTGFLIQAAATIAVFITIFYICANHYIEYFFAYKHTSRELEFKYLLACIWEDQSGSFLLWSLWHSLLGIIFIITNRKKASDGWEAPVMSVISLAQVFLSLMIMGIYLGSVKIGNSPFVLTRNEINGPIFSLPNYLEMIKDGVGLNVLLRNYWMVIHPPVLFLGFASAIIPFGYAYAGIQTHKYGEWVKPAIPYTLFCAAVLGVGIMMGGKWAYESLSFGGYWAWDPVENASLVPWLILIAGLHTMLIYKATGHSLRASYFFALAAFILVLYSSFLTRTGILGDTSVHAFTEAGKAMNILILSFLLAFTLPASILFFVHYTRIPSLKQEEATHSREFWMFIGSLIMMLSAIFVIGKTSTPVFNSIFGTKLAPPEDIEFSYNKVIVLVAILIGILTAVSQYLKYKTTKKSFFLRKIAFPTLLSAILTTTIVFFYPIEYYKQGGGFLAAIYAAFFAAIYAVIANGIYILNGVKGNLKKAGASFTHLGFALMIAGILISSGNKKIISTDKFKTFMLPPGMDPMTRQQDNPAENANLLRDIPNTLTPYTVTYTGDSSGHENGRKFFHLLFEKKDSVTGKAEESFTLSPDVYLMKNNGMSSNPDIRSHLTYDIFTYISYATDPSKNTDTGQFRIQEMAEGDTLFYSKGFLVFNRTIKNPKTNKFNIHTTRLAALADITVHTKDSMQYKAAPMIYIDSLGINQIDDTLYGPNLYVRFAGVSSDLKKIRIGLKESEKVIDFVTIKAYIFPYINLVWTGLIIMALGFVVSIANRLQLNAAKTLILLAISAAALIYLFLFAN